MYQKDEMKWMKKKKMWIKILVVVLILFLIGVAELIIYGYKKAQTSDSVTKEAVEAPLISTYSDQFYIGEGQKVSLQGEILRSVVSYGEEAEVSISCDGATMENGDGEVKDGVPDIQLTFGEAGEYDAIITAEAEKTSEKSVHITVAGELASYVKGIHDWNVKTGTKDLNLMDGIEWDKDYVKEVTVDDSAVDFSKTGDYRIIYVVTPVAENQYPEKIEATMHVLSSEDAKKAAEEGETVAAGNNQTEKTEESAKTTDTTKNSKTAAHEHKWQKTTEVVKHPEEFHMEYIKHPEQGHKETVVTEEQGHYEDHWIYQCNGCRVKLGYKEMVAHNNEQKAAGHPECGSFSSWNEPKWVVDVPETSEDVWVVDREAWTEEKKVVDKQAWTETKTHYICSCGATK